MRYKIKDEKYLKLINHLIGVKGLTMDDTINKDSSAYNLLESLGVVEEFLIEEKNRLFIKDKLVIINKINDESFEIVKINRIYHINKDEIFALKVLLKNPDFLISELDLQDIDMIIDYFKLE